MLQRIKAHKMEAIKIIVAVILAVCSFLYGDIRASSIETHQKTMQELDNEKSSVMQLMMAATTVSTALTSAPGDIASPAADKLVGLITALMLVLAVITTEKYCITLLGELSFKILIPFSCGLFCFHELNHERKKLRDWAVKLFIFAIVLYGMIPLSVHISTSIHETFRESIDYSMTQAIDVGQNVEIGDEEKNVFQNLIDKIGGGVETAKKVVQTALTYFVDGTIIFVVINCVVPILVILAVLEVMKVMFNLDFMPEIMKTYHHLTDKAIGYRHAIQDEIQKNVDDTVERHVVIGAALHDSDESEDID